ncbi:CPBP family intramembrane metalloprotease [Paenibacillus albicereus]|uniref:CPBP family intramembrane metalloprotease n=1 Tax=Paenibacillus albicereus TaxID=2726185 RepID=A0A6H2GVB4_9BACL|nr:type II CAAX endopeptidase family protein [Paenibacillus albicereus]QJC51347.1 CPBP family intramembrane metalloprotease [Paenibacillus albicereus]
MKLNWKNGLLRPLVIIAVYFAWFFTVTRLFFAYVYQDTEWFRTNTLVTILLNDIVGLPLMIAAIWLLFRQNLFAEARFRRMQGPSVAICLWIGLGAGLFTAAFSQLPFIRSSDYQFQTLFDYINRADWYVFLGFLLLGNVYKETLFRGMLLNSFRLLMPVWAAIALQGVLYGALFFLGDVPLSLYGFLGAVLFGLLYVWFDSIWAPIAAQIACQGLQYALWRYAPDLGGEGTLAAIMAAALAMIVSGVLLASRKRRVPPAPAVRTARA